MDKLNIDIFQRLGNIFHAHHIHHRLYGCFIHGLFNLTLSPLLLTISCRLLRAVHVQLTNAI